MSEKPRTLSRFLAAECDSCGGVINLEQDHWVIEDAEGGPTRYRHLAGQHQSPWVRRALNSTLPAKELQP